MDISDDIQLEVFFNAVFQEVVKKISVRITNKLREQIELDVFTETNIWYENTGEFEKAWNWGSIVSGINVITREFYYDPQGMRWDKEKWQHGNPKQSAVENLADILNLAYNGYKAGYTSGLKFGNKPFSHRRRPYWENFIKALFDDGELDEMFKEEFALVGITLA